MLGRRGSGVSVNAGEITARQELSEVVREAFSSALGQSELSPVEYDDKATRRVTLTIIAFEYTTTTDWDVGVYVRGAIKATATRDADSYEGIYRVETEKHFFFEPSENDNQSMINEALNELLSKLVADKGLFLFLAGMVNADS